MNRNGRRSLESMARKALTIGGARLEPGCSFCGRNASEVKGIAPAASGAAICSDCAEAACEAMGAHASHIVQDAIDRAHLTAWEIAFGYHSQNPDGEWRNWLHDGELLSCVRAVALVDGAVEVVKALEPPRSTE